MNTTESNVQKTGRILILIGAILATTMHVLLIFLTFFIWLIPALILIPLIWITRNEVLENKSVNWNIFGVILGLGTDVFSLLGYILLLIESDKQSNNTYNKESINDVYGEYLKTATEEDVIELNDENEEHL